MVEVSSGVSWLQAILIKMIGNDHRAQLSQPAFSPPHRRQGAGFSTSSAIQPP
jgi:hypothetical protein